jgi:hypothetical protein
MTALRYEQKSGDMVRNSMEPRLNDERDTTMNVWIRVYITCPDDSTRGVRNGIFVQPEFAITIYPSEELAKQAARNHGGIALMTDASQLKHLVYNGGLGIDLKLDNAAPTDSVI